jgi:T5SS/PEP-CTERM-associated repeat protein
LLGLDSAAIAGQIVVWGGGNGTWFQQPTNWFCLPGNFACGPPSGSGWDVNIGVSGLDGTVSLDQSVSVDGVILGNAGTGTLNVSGGNSLTTQETIVGNTGPGSGRLNVTGGGSVSDDTAYIGALSGSTGIVNVSGSRSEWTTSGTLYIGDYGQATLNIQSGGTVNSRDAYLSYQPGSASAVTVSGAGSQWNISGILDVGTSAQGTLTIQNGGVVNSGDAGIGTDYAGSMGVVTVSGTGSEWNVGSLFVGLNGRGTLKIQNGGTVNTNEGAYIGPGTVTVSGSGSRWNVGYAFVLGNGGSSSLNISSGAIVSSSIGIIITPSSSLSIHNAGLLNTVGDFASVAGSALVTDPGSRWRYMDELLVGLSGTLTVQNGAVLEGDDGFVGYHSVGRPTVMITGSGSQWNMTESLFVGTNGSALLTVNNGALVSAQTITIGTLGEIDAKGGTLKYGSLQNDGILDPVGTAFLVGNLLTVDPQGEVLLDAKGKAPGQYGRLDITGSAAVHGLVTLNFIDGFAPKKDDVFDLMNISGSADFADYTFKIEGLLPGFEYDLEFNNGQFMMTALNDGISDTPEPGTILLLASGILTTGCAIRKRSV